jgi:hypothetical protein
MQSAAHKCVLQDRVSALCGHALPPSIGSVVARERLWLPLPHDTVHVLQAENDSMTQSVAHSNSLQFWSWNVGPAALPPFSGVEADRVRLCVPPPHETEHVTQAPQAVWTASEAHACVLQSRVSARYGHT